MKSKSSLPQIINQQLTPRRNPEQIGSVFKNLPANVRRFQYNRRTPMQRPTPELIAVCGGIAVWAGVMWLILYMILFVDNLAFFLLGREGYGVVFQWLVVSDVLVICVVFCVAYVGHIMLLSESESAVIEMMETPHEPIIQKPKTVRLEVASDNGRRLNFYELPIDETAVLKLAEHAEGGGKFSRRELSKAGICTQNQYPKLLESFVKSGLVKSVGKKHELTEAFFAMSDNI